MIVIFILIGLSLIVALIFLSLYIWAVKNGQFDDDYTPSVRILFDHNQPAKNNNEEIANENTDNIQNNSKTK